MGVMMLAGLVVLILCAVVLARVVTRQLPPAPSNQDRLLAEQADRIEQLEDELRRVQEQADFTERLLTDRHESDAEDAADRGD